MPGPCSTSILSEQIQHYEPACQDVTCPQPKGVVVNGRHCQETSLQQDENYKKFMGWITDGGLRYASAKQQQREDADSFYQQKVDYDDRKKVIVVGAGMSGLVAAYELAQIGHEVTILEMQSRVGGKVKTVREGFHHGMHGEAGPMRLPPNHYLPKHYITKFQIPIRKFQNYQEKAYMHLYGQNIRMKDFHANNGYYSNLFWPGWDANLSEELKQEFGIEGILDYFGRTIEPVKQELGENPTEDVWHAWIDKWSKFTGDSLLRSSTHQRQDGPQLRPWPEAAIEAFKVAAYMPNLEEPLVPTLRICFGHWKSDNLMTPTEGMETIPRAFIQRNKHGWNTDVDLSKNIVYSFKVERVSLSEKEHGDLDMKSVTVTGINTFTGLKREFNADAIIMAMPLSNLRQIDMPFQEDQKDVLANLGYGEAAKIIIQCRTRFWQKDVGQGGCSKTNMTIGQLHYPDYDGSGKSDDERGILAVYPMGSGVSTFLSQSKQDTIKQVVEQISRIHPEIKTEFECGYIQALCSESTSVETKEYRKPSDVMQSIKCLQRPAPPVFIAGEETSWSQYWIQGAMFSGLMQAFLFQSRVEKADVIVDPVTMMCSNGRAHARAD